MDFVKNVYVCVHTADDAGRAEDGGEGCDEDRAKSAVQLLRERIEMGGQVQGDDRPGDVPRKPRLPCKKKRRRRRRLDVEASLKKYRERLLAGPLRHELHELEDCYLSTFQIFSTEGKVRKRHTNNAFILMEICRELGIHVRGVTSECKIGGDFRAPLLDGDTRDTCRVVYVGNYNYFTQHPESKWGLKPPDKVYNGYI